MKNHDWFSISRTLNFKFCGKCGIIILNNKATMKVVNKPCTGREE